MPIATPGPKAAVHWPALPPRSPATSTGGNATAASAGAAATAVVVRDVADHRRILTRVAVWRSWSMVKAVPATGSAMVDQRHRSARHHRTDHHRLVLAPFAAAAVAAPPACSTGG